MSASAPRAAFKRARVVTVRMADEYTFPGLGPNYTQIVLPFNNTDGDIPYVRKGSDAHFVSPLSKLIYQSDLRYLRILSTEITYESDIFECAVYLKCSGTWKGRTRLCPLTVTR